ncbi:Transcription repressor OFP6 [Hibiscus syriacus]|uniref:Transcription repressor n=1 Tax=Hibiscus syriacus TaxID=106335 RepID=A0A6A2ZI85_HIBSY|nr:transcription repressor OFP6-like [Hibiscus syriacus]KAE8691734.1 Transcription repressor OFP6 [Hibiscus syriacus]
MSSNKKKIWKTLFILNAGWGCSRPKLSDAYEPKPKTPKPPRNPSNAPIEDDDLTSTSFSFNNIDTISSSSITDHLNSDSDLPDLQTFPKPNLARHCYKIVDSIAVVKDSNDPYNDFRHSMLQMIVEKRIYSEDDLQELLRCFLELNSRCHHRLIVEAFTEIRDRIVTVADQEPCLVHGGELDRDRGM